MKRTAVAWVSALVALALNAAVLRTECAAAGGARIISFKEAIRIALEQNMTVRAAQNSAALGQVGVSEATSQFLPNLTFELDGLDATSVAASTSRPASSL